MSNLELNEFHSFLEELIEKSSRGTRFNADKIIETIMSKHPSRLEKVQNQVMVLGLRALIKNNNRSKTSKISDGPDLFGNYGISKRISVPYRDEKGGLHWDQKGRDELSFEDLDEIIARLEDREKKPSKNRKNMDEIVKKVAPYRDKAKTVAEALKMAERDSVLDPIETSHS
ncbi:hypothetical protein ACQY1H_08830 [Agrobacterium vitis]|uniref:hypothetical protein n=1 Tax=Agrobacterium vitis TaxID=373 RepID=UPI0015D83CF8|nr:hypothetical protein [Agrobacterium vitis]BCH59331.1 hypothetical protein RvVAR0630_19550 [Agrobacterium vitis]